MNSPILLSVLLCLAIQPADDQPKHRAERRAKDQPDSGVLSSDHQVRFASSEDGLNFVESPVPVMTQGFMPDVIELGRALPGADAGKAGAKGTILVYAVASEAPRNRRDHPERQLVRVVSTDGAKSWGTPSPVRIMGLPATNSAPAIDPTVVQLDDGRLRLYFYLERHRADIPDQPTELPIPEKPDSPEIPIVPESPDFKPPSTPPETPAPKPVKGPKLPGEREHRSELEVLSAVSDDGLNFTLEQGVRVSDRRLVSPDVFRAGAEWLLVITRGQDDLLCASKDGLNFDKGRKFLVTAGAAPTAVALDNGAIRFYQASTTAINSVVVDARTLAPVVDAGARLSGRYASPGACSRVGQADDRGMGGCYLVFEVGAEPSRKRDRDK